MSDFKISISVPADNPPTSRVDQFGNEYPTVQQSKSDKFAQVLHQIRYQQELEKQQKNENEQKQQQQQQIVPTTATATAAAAQQPQANPMIAFYDHMNQSRIELEQLIFLIDMIKIEKQISLCSTEKPLPRENEQIFENTLRIANKKESLNKISDILKKGAGRMKDTINTMNKWWDDVSTMRTKWRLKGKEVSTMGIPLGMNKANTKCLSIDYGFYTSGSLVEQTEANLSRGPNNGEVIIEFPNVPYQATINKRLYLNVKSSDSKTFNNHSSNNIVKHTIGINSSTPYKSSYKSPNALSSSTGKFTKSPLIKSIANRRGGLEDEDNNNNNNNVKSSIATCTSLLNKAQKYQLHYELFEQLSREAASLAPNPLHPHSVGTQSTNPLGGNINQQSQLNSMSLTTSTGGENIMLTEKEIRIECGSFNLFIGMDVKSSLDEDNEKRNNTTPNPTTTTTTTTNNPSSINTSIFTDQEKNRLLFVLKIILKKVYILQLKRSQKQLTMNLSRRNPRVVFGKKTLPTYNDEVIYKITSILKHMDTYLRLYKVFEILENRLPIKLKFNPASEFSSSLFILNLIDVSQSP
ncbi:hypothetical protein CYY_010581, partial [Polysphondylium violaceum]